MLCNFEIVHVQFANFWPKSDANLTRILNVNIANKLGLSVLCCVSVGRYSYENLSRILCPAQDSLSHPDVTVDVSTMSSVLQNFSIRADLEPIYFE